MANIKSISIDDYIKAFTPEVQKGLQRIRRTIKKTCPQATETISYQIPAFKLNGKMLIYFAAWKDHYSVYPIPKGDAKFTKAISKYQTGKGTVQFKFRDDIPFDLIEQIVKFHIKSHELKANTKKKV